MAGTRYKRMPRLSAFNKTVPEELKTYLDQLSAEIEKGFLEVDRVVTDDDMSDSEAQLRWFLE